MRRAALTSLTAAETELRELRSAGAVFGLLDIDDEFFVIVRPAPAGTRLLLSDATAALDYDIAAEVLEKLDADIDADDLEDADPFEEGDLRPAVGYRPARGGAGRDPRRVRPLRRRAARPHRPRDGLRRRTVGGARPPRSVTLTTDLIRAALDAAARGRTRATCRSARWSSRRRDRVGAGGQRARGTRRPDRARRDPGDARGRRGARRRLAAGGRDAGGDRRAVHDVRRARW